MKKLSFIIIFLILSSLILINCNKKDEFSTQQKSVVSKLKKIPEKVYNLNIHGVIIPGETTITKLDNSTVILTFPQGFELWEFDNNKLLNKLTQMKYTCSCSAGGGCDVIYHDKVGFGCLQSNCDGSCTGSPGEMKNYIVNTNQDITEIVTDDDLKNLKYIPVSLLKTDEIKKQLLNFAQKIYGDDYQQAINYVDRNISESSDLDKIVYVPLKVYGYKLAYGLYMNKLKPKLQKNNAFRVLENGSHTCTCDSGENGCTRDSYMGVKYCKGGNCSKCSMELKIL